MQQVLDELWSQELVYQKSGKMDKIPGRPAYPRPAGLGIPPSGHRLFVDGLDWLLEVGGKGLGPKHVIDRLAGLGLAHLGPPFHQCINQWLRILSQVGLGLETEFGH